MWPSRTSRWWPCDPLGPRGGDHIHHLLARYLESACTGCDHGFKSFHIRENQSAWLTERKPTPLWVVVHVLCHDWSLYTEVVQRSIQVYRCQVQVQRSIQVSCGVCTQVGMLMGTARGGDRHPDLHGVPLIALVLTNMVLVMVVSTRRLSLRWWFFQLWSVICMCKTPCFRVMVALWFNKGSHKAAPQGVFNL